MIATSKPGPKLELLHGPGAAPAVDIDRVTLGEGGVVFQRGAMHGAELAWFLDPRSNRLVSAERVNYGGARLVIDGFNPRGRYTIYLSGPGGWTQVILDGGARTARNAPPRVDGSGIGFSETAWFCREGSVIGYDRAVLTVRHPIGGALRVVPLEVDVVHGAFDTRPYLGLAEGDRVKLELAGPEGAFSRELVFPRAADPWQTYSLDQLARS